MSTLPSSTRPGMIVGLLYLSYLISFGDRIVFGLVLKPVKAVLGLSDTQLGMLAGAAFALSYAIASPVSGLLVDRMRRKSVLIAAILFWSLATAATGLVNGFWSFGLARAATGVGEAFLTPVAVSLISDAVARERRGRAFSLYLSAGAAGSILALLLGGLLVHAVARGAPGGLPAWRLVFLAAGAPGLVLAAVVAGVMREPARASAQAPATAGTARDSAGAFTLRYWPLLLSTFVGLAASQLAAFTWLTWNVNFFERVHRWLAAQAAIWLALTCGVTTLVGCVAGGRGIDALRRRGLTAAPLWVGAASGLAFAILATAGVLCAAPAGALALLTVAGLFGYLPSVSIYATMGDILPPGARGWFAGLHTLAIGLITNSLGPLLVGVLNDRVFIRPDGLRLSLAAVFLGSTLAGALLVAPGLLQYGRRMRERRG